ncbi:MAG: RNA methyltransferase [Candidatus Omnitrophota bacterium]|nr:RNA methyltransferase [Candidatus Omnitrophota bacterium]
MTNSKISIVLAEPENPDNIGAVARAMKNMGLVSLRLVSPPKQWRQKAKKMAVGSYGLVEKAKVFKTLAAALKDTYLVVGTTRRRGPKRGSVIPFGNAIAKAAETACEKRVAVVFGKESKGLSNEQLRLCDWVTAIPTNPDYPSINLAQAVMILSFSLFTFRPPEQEVTEHAFVPKKDVSEVLERLYGAVLHLGYKRVVADRIRNTFHIFMKRNGLVHSEAQMLRGLSRRIRERVVIKPFKFPFANSQGLSRIASTREGGTHG